MKKTLRLLGPTALAVHFAGCALALNMPSARFDSPETHGEFGKGHVGIGVTGSQSDVIVPLTTANPPTQEDRLTASAALPFVAGIGLAPAIDLELRFNVALEGAGPNLIKGKFQVFGPSRPQSKPGDSSLAVTFGGGYARQSKTDQDTLFLSTPQTAKSNLSASLVDLSVIYGTRMLDWLLLYGGAFYTHYSYDADITESGKPSGTYAFKGSSNVAGVNFGTELGKNWFFARFEGTASVSTAAGHSHLIPLLGAEIGGRW